MNKTLEKRIRRLETILQSRTHKAVLFRYGGVKRISADAVGERHIAIISRGATAMPHVEQCEFEERVGPPGPDDEFSFCVYLCSEEDNGDKC